MAEDLNAEIDALTGQLFGLIERVKGNEAAQKKLYGITYGAKNALEDPVNTVWQVIFGLNSPAAITCLLKMGAIEQIVKAGGPITADEIAKATGADKVLITRLLRPLTVQGYFRELDTETYGSTPFADTLMNPGFASGLEVMYDGHNHSLARMPWYLESKGWKNPDGYPGPFEDVKDGDRYFDWLDKNPDKSKLFNIFMNSPRPTRPDWYSIHDVDEIIFNDASKDPEDVLFVDVGGGKGHDITNFHRKFPDVPGKLILQDTPITINSLTDLDPAITPQIYDFYTPQTVKGARIYYFRGIFHDWSYENCVKIFKNTASGMKEGYSKILVHEFLVPPKGADWLVSSLDITMMCSMGGIERTEAQWRQLVQDAGLKLVKIWPPAAEGAESLIEITQ